MGTVRTSTEGLPLSVGDAKEHLRVTDTEEDSYIRALIMAARDYAETSARKTLMAASFTDTFDRFPAVIEPGRWPVRGVTSIGYRDENGSSAQVSSTAYQVDTTIEPGRVMPTEGDTWPNTQSDTFNAVTMVYTAGPSTAATYDFRARAGMLMLVGHWYKHREEVVVMSGAVPTNIPTGAKALFQSMKTGIYP